jgi:predicted ATPase/class 3 adenylate cyclase
VRAPSGTVTFLFTDIEGSTSMWESAPDAMRTALARHDEIVRAAIEAHGGHVFATGGDGFSAAFARPGDAAAAATDAQVTLTGHAWPEGAPIRVRMALHTGAAEERGGDYFGPTLNRAARLMALAHGGQVLVSSVTAELLGGMELVDLGEHRLRDLSAPQRVYQVGAGRFPPLRSLDAFPGNLPLQVSSFIGRHAELARADKALEEARVVTLTGVGGVGKTRLALQVAAQALQRFRDGAWLVELAPIRDPDGVVGAVAAVFGVSPRAGMSLDASLVEFLRAKQLLLIIDNAEHLLEAVAELVDTFERASPRLVVLVTSREGLALDGERVVPVPSLSGPPAGAGAEAAAETDAVRLFVERAQAADPDFGLTAGNADTVVEICRRLDGVPLAIELAAARVSTMTPAELAQGLDRRFTTLAGGRRRAVQRHQTLRAAIDWSYDLLTDAERRLLARLAVFAGGCTRSTAEAVCGAAPLSAAQIFEALTGLVTKSLVVAQRDGAETRYRLLETIREYSEDRLAELGETEMVRGAHAECFCDLARGLTEQLLGPEQVTAARRLAADYDNLLAAVQHAVDTRDADLALRLMSHLPPPGLQVGYRLVLPVDAVLALPGAQDHPLYAFVVAVAAMEAASGGDLEGGSARCDAAVAALERHGSDVNPSVMWIVSNTRGAIALASGQWGEAAALMAHSAALARHLERGIRGQGAMSLILGAAAWAYAIAGDAAAAEPLATEGLENARKLGAPSYIAMNLVALAGALAERDPPRARALLAESLDLHSRLDFDSPFDAVQSALIAGRIGDWALALQLSARAIRQLDWGASWAYLGGVLNVVARALAPSNPEAAAVLQGVTRRLAPAPAPGPSAGQPVSSAATPGGDPGGTASFVTEARRETSAILRGALSEERLRELRAQGEALDRDDAVRYALALLEGEPAPAWAAVT